MGRLIFQSDARSYARMPLTARSVCQQAGNAATPFRTEKTGMSPVYASFGAWLILANRLTPVGLGGGQRIYQRSRRSPGGSTLPSSVRSARQGACPAAGFAVVSYLLKRHQFGEHIVVMQVN